VAHGQRGENVDRQVLALEPGDPSGAEGGGETVQQIRDGGDALARQDPVLNVDEVVAARRGADQIEKSGK